MDRIRSLFDTILRTVLFVVAAAAMLLVCGGVGWYGLSGGKIGTSPQPATVPTSRPVPSPAENAAPRDTSIEGILLGTYLQIRQGDVNRAAGQSDEMVSFVIEQGETAAAVSSNLAQAGLLTDPGFVQPVHAAQSTGFKARSWQLSAAREHDDAGDCGEPATQHGRRSRVHSPGRLAYGTGRRASGGK